ncbi:ATP-binding protein [Amycolatopsis cihanbeyliensis]|uniref:Putative ATPase n=1 Tax=Amycolatopsis cihanbeyliensis TaxID=1128664 RepID=A0A542DS89_AMYCI|nr:LuxR C-terminal-related transcriptional regulator [Amycolatopsis cihanbeyliensis]TQJ05920.1 putative ATPase [Amycolatopsis cihanbeyliensis]
MSAPSIYAPTELVGRAVEFGSLRDELLGPGGRMITVTGPVGVGKSRLAAALFEHVSPEFEDGGCFLDLTDVDPLRPDGVLAAMITMAEAEAGTEAATAQERVVSYLRDKHFLLVLDGCEHLMEMLPSLLAALVTACPRLSTLVVSLEPLRVYGEALFRLTPLPVPDPRRCDDLAALQQVPAVLLFVQRTRAVRPGFTLTTENREAVARLSVLTDGLPLAIELAAAQMKLSSPQNLLATLDGDLARLSGTGSDTLSRHHCMRAAVAWSLKRLRNDEQMFLGSLALFPDQFDLDAAGGVARTGAAETHRFLEQLVDRNLLQTGECLDGDLTFSMFGLTRLYVLQWLRQTGDYERVLRGHADYFLDMAETAESALAGPGQARWLHRLESWHGAVEVALRFLTSAGDGARAVSLASALRLYWLGRGKATSGKHWLKEGLGTEGLPEHLAAKGEAVLGELMLWTGEQEAAVKCLTSARGRYQELGDPRGDATCLNRLGLAAYYHGDLAEAERVLDESVVAFQALDLTREHAMAMRDLADCHRASGNLKAAKEAAEAALADFLRQQDLRNVALTRYVLADVALDLADRDEAGRLYDMSLRELDELGDLSACAIGLEKSAILLTSSHGRITESWRRAARALGTASDLRATTGCVAPQPAQLAVDGAVAEARVRLGDHAIYECWAEGAALEPEAAIAEALTPAQSPQVARLRGLTADSPLTCRELEVAGLVAGGMTNREIGRRLGIAEWTAVNHIRKIMRKLDCTSRVQVASWMTKTGTGSAVAMPKQPDPRARQSPK